MHGIHRKDQDLPSDHHHSPKGKDHGPDEEGADLRSQQLSHLGAAAQQEHQDKEHDGHHHQLPDRHSDGVGETVGHKVWIMGADGFGPVDVILPGDRENLYPVFEPRDGRGRGLSPLQRPLWEEAHTVASGRSLRFSEHGEAAENPHRFIALACVGIQEGQKPLPVLQVDAVDDNAIIHRPSSLFPSRHGYGRYLYDI